MASTTNSSGSQLDWNKLWELFDELEGLSPEDRKTRLRAIGQDSPTLRSELESLLAAGDQTSSLLDQSIDSLGLDTEKQVDRPARVGPYRIEKELGRGGMGEVYLGVRDDDAFEQKVAIKLAPMGRYSEEALRRFLIERQILSDLNHPNIAKLFDGGTTEEGVPYLVMEYVDGVAIDEYCIESGLSLSQRLELFATTCRAVHFAHQKLIVHRDIKPSNVLVDRDGQPKLLDFGVAKLLNPEDSAPVTQTLHRMATPEYASPEQLRGESLSTSTDVYSLGVLLYEIISGNRPYDVDTRDLRSTLDVVCTTMPPPPSSVARAQVRRRLRKELKGDLDNITLMALRKNPDRRYPSAEALAQDIDRHLTGLPVVARAESAGYLIQKFVQRHPVGVGLAGAALAVLVFFTVTSTRQAQRLAAALETATVERNRASEVSGFLQDLFKISDPMEGLGAQISARELLDNGRLQLAERLGDQPEIQAGLQASLGKVYTNLAAFQPGEDLLRQALDSRLAQGAPRSEVIQLQLDLADNLVSQQRAEESLDILKPLESLIAEDNLADRSRMALIFSEAYGDLGQLSEAETYARRAMEDRIDSLGERDPAVADARTRLAVAHWLSGEFQVALKEIQTAHESISRALGPDHARTARTLYTVGLIKDAAGIQDEAEAAFREVIRIRRMLFGEEDLRTAAAMNALGARLYAQGRYEEAQPLLEDAIRINLAVWGEPHTSVVMAQTNLALIHVERGNYDRAVSLLESNLEINEAAYGPDHLSVGYALNNLGLARQDNRDLAGAADHFERAYTILRQSWGPDHPGLAYSLSNLAQVLHDMGESERAESLARQSLALRRRGLAKDDPAVAASLQALARILIDQNALELAQPLAVEALAIRRAKMAPGDWRTGEALILAALVDSPAERAAAVAQFETGLKFMKNHLIEGHWRIEWAQRQGVAAGFGSDY